MAASHFLTGTHHCAILHGDEHGLANLIDLKKCTLNPGHEKFMTVDEYLKKDHSKKGLDDRDMAEIRNRIARTVRVVVHHTSVDRPDTFINSETPYPCNDIKGDKCRMRYGTGYLVARCNDGKVVKVVDDDDKVDENDNGNDDNVDVTIYLKEPCPCRTSKCRTPNRKSYYFVVQTSTHVIFDEQEARKTVIEFFFDSEDSKVEKLHGVSVLGSRDLRLQTDRCRVVCITHDGNLAEKLGDLCKGPDPLLRMDNVLVSHPHGVSKRVSVADRYSETIIVLIPNKTSVKLMKGTETRFPGCHDYTQAVQDINRITDKCVIVFDDVSKTFILDCDLTVFRPEGVIMETEFGDYFDFESGDPMPKNKVWCNMFFPGTQLVTEDGKRYTFPYNDDKVPRVRVEVFVKTEHVFDKNDRENHSVFMYTRYNIASCPGSSGARVGEFGCYFDYGIPGQAHFGNSGYFNTSSLFCVHTPDDGEQESATKDTNKLNDDNSEVRQRMYDYVTGKSEY